MVPGGEPHVPRVEQLDVRTEDDHRTPVTMASAAQTVARVDTAVLDIDGTLVDSVYAHVWSWREAFRTVGLEVPTWRVHRAIGMGGDRLVAALTSSRVEVSLGDEIRRVQSTTYGELSRHLAPTPGARDLLSTLKSRGLHVALASSGARKDSQDAVALLDADTCIDALVSGDDSDLSKPATEPVIRAIDAVGGERAVVVGDSTWDLESARKAGHHGVGVLTGGIAESELLGAGAVAVFKDPAALCVALDDLLALLNPAASSPTTG
jgi:phosphoglycolate phosphatase